MRKRKLKKIIKEIKSLEKEYFETLLKQKYTESIQDENAFCIIAQKLDKKIEKLYKKREALS